MKTTDNPDSGLPDFKFINRIPVIDVARNAGFDVTDDGRIRCPRSDTHPDRTSRFLEVLPSSNKVLCQFCGTGLMSVLDMVQKFWECGTLRDAAEYIASYYPEIPRKSKGSHLRNPNAEKVPPLCRDPLALLITSGVWSELSVPVKLVIVTFLTLSHWKDDGEDHVLTVSYLGMMRYSGNGLQSPNEVSDAVNELKAIGWLERLPARTRGHSPIKQAAQYRLTPLSPCIRKLADDTAQKFGAAIQAEKAIQREKRAERDRKRAFPSLAKV